ncbi:MAG: hypothetical protein HKO62_04140 [Gammaproteobacteria bacterium]|nr:hypothetical protein [Gammaproteobacteria bacterium]NNL99917.1 hypothetical protein [Gammaproteobacteria bacterium]
MTTESRSRIMIVVTDTSAVQDLFNAALARTGGGPTELIALFLADDRWARAASLPFTNEISRIGGVAEFTAQRAQQLASEAEARAERLVRQLADEAKLTLAFEVLSERDQQRIAELAETGANMLIAPSLIATHPAYALLTRLNCRIELIETSPAQRRRD